MFTFSTGAMRIKQLFLNQRLFLVSYHDISAGNLGNIVLISPTGGA
jgi:hypothetical protein